MTSRSEPEITAIWKKLNHGLPISVADQQWLWNLMVISLEPVTVEHEEWCIATRLGPIKPTPKICNNCEGNGCQQCEYTGYVEPKAT